MSFSARYSSSVCFSTLLVNRDQLALDPREVGTTRGEGSVRDAPPRPRARQVAKCELVPICSAVMRPATPPCPVSKIGGSASEIDGPTQSSRRRVERRSHLAALPSGRAGLPHLRAASRHAIACNSGTPGQRRLHRGYGPASIGRDRRWIEHPRGVRRRLAQQTRPILSRSSRCSSRAASTPRPRSRRCASSDAASARELSPASYRARATSISRASSAPRSCS